MRSFPPVRAQAHELRRFTFRNERLALTPPPRSGGEGRRKSLLRFSSGWGELWRTKRPPLPTPPRRSQELAGGGELSVALQFIEFEMRLTVIGSGDAFGSGGRFNTCFMI